ncbi:hypothetical protein BLNAU_22484 [Blattamonas nauphoetae]|uniref:Uncharacterized protein n=1 Tax=Blattamonas nauphoetae TaxID=2049346 RepID=A0ABQ9WU14_9EUKA|nr:hypothetical protein BLNAU_22484 [Blattamonas nauphoetae]
MRRKQKGRDEDQQFEVDEDIEGEYEQAEKEDEGTRSMGENEEVEENEHEQTGEMEKVEENDNAEDKQEEAVEDEVNKTMEMPMTTYKNLSNQNAKAEMLRNKPVDEQAETDDQFEDNEQVEGTELEAEKKKTANTQSNHGRKFKETNRPGVRNQSDIQKIKLRISEITLIRRKIGFPRRNKPEEQDGQEEVKNQAKRRKKERHEAKMEKKRKEEEQREAERQQWRAEQDEKKAKEREARERAYPIKDKQCLILDTAMFRKNIKQNMAAELKKEKECGKQEDEKEQSEKEVENQGAMTMTKLNVIPLAQCSLISLENDGVGGVGQHGNYGDERDDIQIQFDKTTTQPITIKITVFNSSLADQGIFAQPLLSLFTNAEPEILLNNVTFKNLKMVEKTQDSGDTDHQDRIEWSDIIHRHNIRSVLMYSLEPPVTRILLNASVNEASTHPNCGSYRFTCSSLDSGYRLAETNEFEEVQTQANSELLKTMRITHEEVIQSHSEAEIRTITQKSDAGIDVNAEGKTATLKHMIFKLVPATTMKTFVSVETGVLSLGKEGEHTDAGGHTIQKLSFTHETLRTVLYIEAWGVLSTTQGSPFMEINSNATGSLVFLESDDLERDSKLEPLTFFSCATESVLWGDGRGGRKSEEKLTVNDDGDDNDVCGLVELPCSSLDFGFEHLKKEEKTLETNGSADLRLDFSDLSLDLPVQGGCSDQSRTQQLEVRKEKKEEGKKIPFHSDPRTSSRWLSPLTAACLQTLICLLTVDPTLPLPFTPDDQGNIFNINFHPARTQTPIHQFRDLCGRGRRHHSVPIVLHRVLSAARRYLDVLTQRQTNSDILKTPFSHPFLASFTSTLFHLLSFVMLSYETITKQQTLSFSKGHKSTGPLGKEFKSKFDLPFVFKSPTNSHKAQSASESLTLASPPLRLFNPRQSLRMSIVRQPTPATPQQFTAGRSTPPLDDSLPEEISGDMRLAFVQHPATRFESDDSDPEPPPPPENEEWESDVLLPSPPQTMPTLTQRRRRMFLVSVQIITHSLSLLIPPVCDDFMQLLNLGTNRESPNEKASEERIVDPTQIPNPSTLSVALDSTQQFTFDMSTAGTRYNVEHDAAFLMLLNEAFHRTSFNLTPNPQRMETMLIIDGPNPLLN